MRRGDSGRLLRLFFRMSGRLKVVVTVLAFLSELVALVESVVGISRGRKGEEVGFDEGKVHDLGFNASRERSRAFA
jgi:hypothetical protein